MRAHAGEPIEDILETRKQSTVPPPAAESLEPVVETEKFRGDAEILREVAKENLTAFKTWLLETYEDEGLDEEKLHSAVGEHFYRLISGDADGFLKLVGENVPLDGDAAIKQALLEENLPFLKADLLTGYGISDEQLKLALGQAYEVLGFDKITAEQLAKLKDAA